VGYFKGDGYEWDGMSRLLGVTPCKLFRYSLADVSVLVYSLRWRLLSMVTLADSTQLK
jgi:hypothetical protein